MLSRRLLSFPSFWRVRVCTLRSFFTSSKILLQSTSCSTSEDGKNITLLCDGEPERRYHGVWLRHNCRCPQCLTRTTNQNLVPFQHLQKLKIIDAKVQGSELHVDWIARTGGHSCSFDISWLKKHDYTTPGIHEERRKREEPLIAETLPVSDYNAAVSSKEGYYHWMRQINLYGITLMKNVPIADQCLVKFCEQIADPQPQGCLRVNEVRAVPNPSNLAYANTELIPHSDQNMLESAPGIQFFHCLRFDDCVEGGESVIIDAYPVIEELRVNHPRQFDVLTRIPYIAIMEHQSVDDQNIPIRFLYSAPHIRLDSHQRVIGINWSPQLHGPLSAPEKDTEDYYEAFILLSSMFESSPQKILHRLRPGEALIFNNRRVLHSRKSFNTNGGERHFQCFYLNIDFFRSRFTVLAEELNKDEPIKHFFNTSYVA